MRDAFETLGLPVRFDLDLAELQKRFIQSSAAAHPDRHIDPVAQAEAADRAAAINEAFRVLRAPESRAEVLLALLGGPSKESDKALPPDLLMEMMEARERMEEAVASKDTATLKELGDWARDRRASHLKRLGELFATAQESQGPDRALALKSCRLEVNALRYFQRMIEQAPPP